MAWTWPETAPGDMMGSRRVATSCPCETIKKLSDCQLGIRPGQARVGSAGSGDLHIFGKIGRSGARQQAQEKASPHLAPRVRGGRGQVGEKSVGERLPETYGNERQVY